MKFYDVSCDINASPETIFSVLTDLAALQHDTGITRLEGELCDGGRITLYSEVSPRPFKLRVSLDAPRKMVWTGGMPLGLFKGARTFTLNANGPLTRFHMREEFSGVMLGLIWKSMPNLQPGFDKFANSIKQQAEAT